MFVRGGWVIPGRYLNSAGDVGRYWSSDGFNSSYAFYLEFGPNYIDPSHGYYRYLGQSVRCVALGG